MPSIKKIVHFMSSGLLTSIAVGLLGYGMSQKWSETTMNCISNEATSGSAVITLTLFDGMSTRTFCPAFGGNEVFKVFPKLGELGGTPIILHALVVLMLVVSLLCSALCILLSFYNSVSNPYETYMGPIGFYTCSFISVCLSSTVLIMYVVSGRVTNMAEDLVLNPVDKVMLRNKVVEMQLGYYLVIPYLALTFCAIGVIYLYEHAAYTQRREQQRPTEDAPKEIMMY